MRTSIIQHIMLKEGNFAQNIFIYNFRIWYVPPIHTKEHVFTRYTSMYTVTATIKILEILTKMLVFFDWILAKFHHKQVMKQ